MTNGVSGAGCLLYWDLFLAGALCLCLCEGVLSEATERLPGPDGASLFLGRLPFGLWNVRQDLACGAFVERDVPG